MEFYGHEASIHSPRIVKKKGKRVFVHNLTSQDFNNNCVSSMRCKVCDQKMNFLTPRLIQSHEMGEALTEKEKKEGSQILLVFQTFGRRNAE